MNAETSDSVASIAGRLVQITADDLFHPSNDECGTLASDIRSVAASALRQHEADNSVAKRIDEVYRAAATDPGNALADEYLRGMANGLILAQSIVHDTEPKYINPAPEQVDISRVASTNGIHPAPDEFSEKQLATDQILRYFHYAHLPPMLRGISQPFCRLAGILVINLPRNAERSVALRKLLEAKDAAVRANIGNTSAQPSGAPFVDRMKAQGEKLAGTDSTKAEWPDQARRPYQKGPGGFEARETDRRLTAAEMARCTCGESKAPCPVHEPDLQDAGPFDSTDSTPPILNPEAREITGDEFRTTGRDNSEDPIPFRDA